MLLFVLSAQALGIVMIGLLPDFRLGISFASLWGVISFSISGFSFPVSAMHPMLQALSNLFPLRHYFLVYVDQAQRTALELFRRTFGLSGGLLPASPAAAGTPAPCPPTR